MCNMVLPGNIQTEVAIHVAYSQQLLFEITGQWAVPIAAIANCTYTDAAILWFICENLHTVLPNLPMQIPVMLVHIHVHYKI